MALPEIARLLDQQRTCAALRLVGQAEKYLPSDTQDDAEVFAERIEATPMTDTDRFEGEYVGGPYAGESFHRPALERA